MYRGIIQEGNWTKEGSYLRKVVLQYGLDKPVGLGRIYRLVHESAKPGPLPKMNSETPAQLVAHLAHPNGWWRDTAQKLLVLKQDHSVVPALTAMARDAQEPARPPARALDARRPRRAHAGTRPREAQGRTSATPRRRASA